MRGVLQYLKELGVGIELFWVAQGHEEDQWVQQLITPLWEALNPLPGTL